MSTSTMQTKYGTMTAEWPDLPDDFRMADSDLIPPKPPKFYEVEQDEFEQCPFCGCLLEDPCDRPPPDYCDKAIAATYTKDLMKALNRD